MSNQPRTEAEAVELETINNEHNRIMGEDLNELRKIPAFQRLILDGYLGQKVMASVSLLGVPQIKDQGKRPDVMEDLVAASNLKYFFQTVDSFYEGCMNPILSDEEEEELLAAQNENGVN